MLAGAVSLELARLTTRQASLEDVFVSLTGRHLRDNDEAPAADGRDGFAGLADKAVTEIREEFATEDMDLGRGRNDEPMAKLSPQGDLIIGGQAIPLDASQREKVLAFREQLVEVAAGGADIGIQGASLATKALGDAAAAIASGETAGLEAKIEAEADAMRDAAQALCNRIPELRAARDAAALHALLADWQASHPEAG